jgi:hypothetical protein
MIIILIKCQKVLRTFPDTIYCYANKLAIVIYCIWKTPKVLLTL